MGIITDNSKQMAGPLICGLDITNKCNLKCLHCYNRSGQDLNRQELTDEEVLKFIDQLCKLKIFSFCFCGGETLLRYDLIIEATKRLSKTCPNINIVTNGLLLTKEKILELKKAGIGSIQISLDGACSKTHDYMRGVDGAFKKSFEAVELVSSLGFPINIAFCPTNFNIHEFPKLVEKLLEIKYVGLIRTQPFMTLGRGSLNKIEPTEDEYRNLVSYIRDLNLKVGKKLIEWGDPIDHIIRFSTLNMNSLSLNIQSDGNITISPYLPFSVGNIKKHSLEEYWKAGLGQIWRLPFMKEVGESQSSISYLGASTNIPKVFFDGSFNFDIIDDDVFNNLEKFTFKNLFGDDVNES